MGIQTIFQKIKSVINQPKSKVLPILILSLGSVGVQIFYIGLRYQYLNELIPLWYTQDWGPTQLTVKANIYAIPIATGIISTIGTLLILANVTLFSRKFIRYFNERITVAVMFANSILSWSLYRIINTTSNTFKPLVGPEIVDLFLPALLAFAATYLLLPYFIEYAQRKKLVTNPSLHSHPAMILTKPSARGGGFIYAIIFIVIAIVFTGVGAKQTGFYISLALLAFLGIIDDYQNTHSSTSFKILENPALRLTLMFLSILPVILSGTRIDLVSNPLGGFLELSKYTVQIGNMSVPLLSGVVSALWIVWILNLLSWSNGIDGQYCGIIGVASILIALLSLRFEPLSQYHKQLAIMGAISAGTAFAFAKYTWHPSKIMWGFGATTAGLVLAVLSISAQNKIGTSLIIILVPFLDAIVTVVRRLIQGKNPLKGDRGHLHHLLMDRGWSVQKIAIFYWVTTAVFGAIIFATSEKYILQTGLILSGVVAFFIILLNLRSLKVRQPKQQTE